MDESRRNQWIQACKRINGDGSCWIPKSKYTYICSEHFLEGKPSKDKCSPDYVPSVFKHEKAGGNKRKLSIERYNRAKKRRIGSDEFSTSFSVDENVLHDDGDLVPCVSFVCNDDHGEIDDVSDALPFSVAVQVQPEVSSLAVQVDENSLIEEMNNLSLSILKTERRYLMTKMSCLKQQAMVSLYNPEVIFKNDEASQYLTGLSWNVFNILSCHISPNILPPRTNIPIQNQILMVLVRLRLCLPLQYLSMQTGVSISTINATFCKIIDLMYAKLRFLICWSDREFIRRTLPPPFKKEFPKMTSIIDCFEIFIERPKNLKARAQVYSNYKKHSTVKFLISISPLGVVNFLSQAWGGRATDIKITRESGFISSRYHHPGDQILADRGFTLKDDFAAGCSAELIIPAFTKGKSQLSANEVETTRKIANIRIHVERVIGHVKKRYQILDGPIPITLVKSFSDELCSGVPNIEKLVTVCCALINLSTGIVYSE